MIAYVDNSLFLCFEKGLIVMRINNYNMSKNENGFVDFRIIEPSSKLIHIKRGTPQYKRFVELYLTEDNLTQLLLKSSDKNLRRGLRKWFEEMAK